MNGENFAVNILNNALKNSVSKLCDNIETEFNFNFNFERPKHEGQGDRATNAAMKLTKILKSSPKNIAENLINNLNSDESIKNFINKIEIAGPGFVNLFLSGNFYAEVVRDILKQSSNYGAVNLGNNKKVQVEFVSANPTGPLHVGHGRGAAVGDSVARILEFTGWNVQREYYINDAGLQMENLGKSTQARYFELLGKKNFELPENGYKGEYLYKIAQDIININGDKFINIDPAESLEYFKNYAGGVILEGIKKDLEEFRVKFDNYFNESIVHKNGLVKNLLEELKNKNYAYEQDGALWFRSQDFGDDKDRVLIRANGVTTYFASDVGYFYDKFKVRNFDWVIDVWGADHHGYITRVKAAISAIGKNPDDLDILLIQLVNLIRDGKSVNMSTRSGEFIELRSVLDEVGTDATRYFFLMRRSDSQLDFDLDLAREQSSNNPVYYIQYAHARISGIMREFERRNKNNIDLNIIPAEIFYNKDARNLADALSFFPDEIKNASSELAPQVITSYVLNLAGIFHGFYNTNRILDEPDEKISVGRLNLIRAAQNVIKICLNLLGVNAPDRM